MAYVVGIDLGRVNSDFVESRISEYNFLFGVCMIYRFPTMTIFAVLFFYVPVSAQTVDEELKHNLYDIELRDLPASGGKSTGQTKLFSRDGQTVLAEATRTENDSDTLLLKSYRFGEFVYMLVNTDGQHLPRGVSAKIESKTSAFGWYGDRNRKLLDTISHLDSDSLLLATEDHQFRLLERAELKTFDSEGVVAALENRLGVPLVQKKGVTVDIKFHIRNKILRCQERTVKISDDEVEKRRTFFGNFDGTHCIFFEWVLNSKSKLSWIDAETGMGSFTFVDNDLDGDFDTLECDVLDEGQRVEIFDISDPWNIRLVDPPELEDANNRYLQNEKMIKELGRRFAPKDSDKEN